ncbi:hypothetical protein [Sandaracinus amylolyticus]|uniref:Uncharacterized protein n=1 Tax=Sandaracinus amylolyticus TaxID=927083 RepID=A0A0F6YI57_9BACT|nr:hypothetical protein [Sandaracinus amylolyticus]AKF06626.1 hypothetical protein DB32_003775 [Sandaracinus amylolyticus]
MSTHRDRAAIVGLVTMVVVAYLGAYCAARASHRLVHEVSFDGSASEIHRVCAGDDATVLWELPFVPLARIEGWLWYLD